jgi:hypothetical protein
MMFAMGLRSSHHRRGRTPVITVCCTRSFVHPLAYRDPLILGTIERLSGEEHHHWRFPENGRNNVLAAVINALYNTSMNIMDKLDGLAPSAWPEALDDYHREGLINKTRYWQGLDGAA